MHISEGIGYVLGPSVSGFFLEKNPSLIFLLSFLIFLSSALSIIPLKESPRKKDQRFFPSLKLVFYVGFFIFVCEFLRGFSMGLINPSLPVYLEGFAAPSFVGFLMTNDLNTDKYVFSTNYWKVCGQIR